jgi:hypothetical protein
MHSIEFIHFITYVYWDYTLIEYSGSTTNNFNFTKDLLTVTCILTLHFGVEVPNFPFTLPLIRADFISNRDQAVIPSNQVLPPFRKVAAAPFDMALV